MVVAALILPTRCAAVISSAQGHPWLPPKSQAEEPQGHTQRQAEQVATMIGIQQQSDAGVQNCALSRGRHVGGRWQGAKCAMQMSVYSLLGLCYLNLSLNRFATA